MLTIRAQVISDVRAILPNVLKMLSKVVRAAPIVWAIECAIKENAKRPAPTGPAMRVRVVATMVYASVMLRVVRLQRSRRIALAVKHAWMGTVPNPIAAPERLTASAVAFVRKMCVSFLAQSEHATKETRAVKTAYVYRVRTISVPMIANVPATRPAIASPRNAVKLVRVRVLLTV